METIAIKASITEKVLLLQDNMGVKMTPVQSSTMVKKYLKPLYGKGPKDQLDKLER